MSGTEKKTAERSLIFRKEDGGAFIVLLQAFMDPDFKIGSDPFDLERAVRIKKALWLMSDSVNKGQPNEVRFMRAGGGTMTLDHADFALLRRAYNKVREHMPAFRCEEVLLLDGMFKDLP